MIGTRQGLGLVLALLAGTAWAERPLGLQRLAQQLRGLKQSSCDSVTYPAINPVRVRCAPRGRA